MDNNENLLLLARIDERVSMILEHLKELNGSVGNCKKRIGILENWRSYTLGGLAVVGGAVAIIWGFVAKIIF